MKDTLTINWFDPEAVKPADNTDFFAMEKETGFLCYGINFVMEEQKRFQYVRLNGELPPVVFTCSEKSFEKIFTKWGLK